MKLRHILLATALTLPSVSAFAQNDANVEGRVKKLEKEVRAIQRQVFPGGAGKYFEPEIKPEGSVKQGNNAPATSAVTDLIGRVDALEAQLARLTGQVEQQGNDIRTMEARLKALEGEVSGSGAAPAVATSSAASTKPATKPAAGNPRAQAVAAIGRPSTGDAFEDSYIYGYRLWAEKFYPEAQVQLQSTVKKHPKHRRASFARNLLGRSWLDDGKPASAAKVLYANYKDIPTGARAPDSLYFLGVALTRMKQTTNACKTFTQLETAFPQTASGRLAARLANGRAKAKCK
ncbi:MAG: hypothetical protein V3V15_08915 [Sphingorhabdus sp.]